MCTEVEEGVWRRPRRSHSFRRFPQFLFHCERVSEQLYSTLMLSMFSLLLGLLLATAQQPTTAAQNAAPSTFVGTWVATQAWAIDSPSPSAKEEQPVELKIDLVGGQLIGFMTPWFGGSDGATVVQTTIEGDQLLAMSVVAKPPAPGPSLRRGDWKNNVRIQCNFKSDVKDSLTGTADVLMNDTKWLKFSYNLSKKRSRY